MAAPKNFATGFNHNVQHKGQMYHVQTEDSGSDNAALNTHLFVGGTIVASLRSSYATIALAPDRTEQVRALMEAQHKQMLRNLVNGQYDGMGAALPSYQPGELETGTLLARGAAEGAKNQPAVTPEGPPAVERTPSASFPAANGTPPALPAGESFFGADLISEKSLDQVILAYLAGEDEDG